MLYPLNIDLTGRRIVVVGGGMVAERKVHGILAADATADILVIAPEVTAGLHAHAEAGRITWSARECDRRRGALGFSSARIHAPR